MFSTLKDMLRPRPAAALAAQELEQARAALLEAQSAREYAEAMCAYHQARINRLRAVAAVPLRSKPGPSAELPESRGRLDNLNLPSVGPHGY